METPQAIEPTKPEKDHIVDLVKRVGRRERGVLIKDEASLQAWAGVKNGFDARFLAMIFECQLHVLPYSDAILAGKLEGWLSWYRRRFAPQGSFGVQSVRTAAAEPIAQSESKRVNSKDWFKECSACDGQGLVRANGQPCQICCGTGWMTRSQHETYQVAAQATLTAAKFASEANTRRPMPVDEQWKKSRSICSVCDGDGGAAGQCYRCGGSGWVF